MEAGLQKRGPAIRSNQDVPSSCICATHCGKQFSAIGRQFMRDEMVRCIYSMHCLALTPFGTGSLLVASARRTMPPGSFGLRPASRAILANSGLLPNRERFTAAL